MTGDRPETATNQLEKQDLPPTFGQPLRPVFSFAFEHHRIAVKCFDVGVLRLPQSLNLLLQPLYAERHLGLMDIVVPRFRKLENFFANGTKFMVAVIDRPDDNTFIKSRLLEIKHLLARVLDLFNYGTRFIKLACKARALRFAPVDLSPCAISVVLVAIPITRVLAKESMTRQFLPTIP